MQISDLVAIGKLGKLIDENGFIPFKPNKNFHLNLLENIFLVFKDNSVRYVTVEKLINSNRIKIDDSETAKTAADEGNVRVMLPKIEIDTYKKQLNFDDQVGKKIIFNSKSIGEVVDIINNSVYELLICNLNDGKELIIPLLDNFVLEINDEDISVINIEGLMEI